MFHHQTSQVESHHLTDFSCSSGGAPQIGKLVQHSKRQVFIIIIIIITFFIILFIIVTITIIIIIITILVIDTAHLLITFILVKLAN